VKNLMKNYLKRLSIILLSLSFLGQSVPSDTTKIVQDGYIKTLVNSVVIDSVLVKEKVQQIQKLPTSEQRYKEYEKIYKIPIEPKCNQWLR
jgi:membrane protein involved in colicin uptake